MAQDNKYSKAVDRATKTDAPTAKEQTPNVTGPAMIATLTKDDLAAFASRDDLEFAPQIMSLEPYQKVEGILEGNGPDAEFEHLDKATGVVTTSVVKTWIISAQNGGQRISILSSAQLDRKLPPFVGGTVTIIRGLDINTGNGQRVTEYLVAGPRLKDGQRRQWATRPVLDVGTAPAPQLPAGNSTPAS